VADAALLGLQTEKLLRISVRRTSENSYSTHFGE
jgi:hypothetical protein